MRFGSAPREDQMGDAMREHVGLAGARAGDDEQRLRAVRIADAMLHREPLRVVEVGQGRGANRGEHAGRKQGLRGGGKGKPRRSTYRDLVGSRRRCAVETRRSERRKKPRSRKQGRREPAQRPTVRMGRFLMLPYARQTMGRRRPIRVTFASRTPP